MGSNPTPAPAADHILGIFQQNKANLSFYNWEQQFEHKFTRKNMHR
jgi:hypothetical protein